MPVVAVVAAVAIDGFALAGGIAAMSTLTAITAIGATLGAIGAVTGNRTLGLIGAGIGLVGGIGALAFGSGALGTVGELFGSTAAEGAGAAGAAADVAAGVGDAAVGDTAYLPGAVEAADLPAATVSGAAVDATGAVTAADPAGLINATMAAPEGSAAAIASAGDTSGVVGSALGGVDAARAAELSREVAAAAPAGSSAYDAGQLSEITNSLKSGAGATGGIMNWAKNNQLLAFGVLQAGGSFISGLTDPMTPAQIAALNSQAAANNAAAALTNRQVSNIASGQPTASVTGKPAGGSLLNNTPATKAAPVTGTINATTAQAPNAVTGAAA